RDFGTGGADGPAINRGDSNHDRNYDPTRDHSYRRDSVKLKSIKIRRMPGIEEPFPIEDVSPGMNVIEGPNGAGKTSLCRAIAATLWTSKAQDLELDAQWQDEGLMRTVERRGSKCHWQANGITSQPTIPPAHLASCFTIRVDEILHIGAEDTDLATLVAN